MTKGETGTKEVMRNKFVTIYSWADEKTHHELVKVCDIIVGRAGHGVITKSMFYRKPMVLIPIPDHTEQWNNAKTCVKLGFGVILEQRQITAENLNEVLNEALKLDPDRLDKVYGTFLKEGGKSATNLIFSLIRSDTTLGI